MGDIHEFYTREELIQLTRSLIRIPSHKDVPGREKEVAEFIYRFCMNHDIEAELILVEGGRSNVTAFLRGDGTGKTLILNGHMDTVPPYHMSIDPFQAEMEGGVIFGRGAADMKGPIASMLITILALKRSGKKLRGDVIFTGVIGEEERSEGTEFLVKSGLKADGAVVGEPSDYEYAIGHRGLEWLEIRIKGKAAHGGTPQLGINAIEKAAALIERIRRELYPELKLRFNEYMGPSVMNFGVIQGGSQPSTVADECSIKIDRRYIPGETVASVIKEFQDIIDTMRSEDPEFEAEIIRIPDNMLTLDHLYLVTDPQDPIVLSVKESIRAVTGREPEITRKRGWTDAALISNYGNIPAVVFGPGKLSASHTKDESIEVSQLVDAVEIYSGIIERFCGSY
ncbi:MAG TPA: M20 family metallopeptidase [Bacillota bacterium]|nr:M20 family metallopeptidase [Bacillota bacterium]